MAQADASELRYGDSGYTNLGEWYADVSVRPAQWQPSATVQIQATLQVSETHLAKLAELKIKPDGLVMLVTAERTFDGDGVLRLGSDERMSTLLTPTGLAIEGGVQGAVTNRFGYRFRTPVDVLNTVPLSALADRRVTFNTQAKLPDDLPPGIYRVRLDFGVSVAKRNYDLNGDAFAKRGFPQGRPTESYVYSPPIRADGKHVSGRVVDAAAIKPRVPWVILGNYNSNGYRGVVADEDAANFALSVRNLIPDEVILPLYDDNNKPLAYSLEPQFPADTIDARSNIPWDFAKGELSIQVTGPDGKTNDLGTAPFVGKAGQWPTTKKPAFTAWRPPSYGLYTVKATGWLADIWGNRYEGGGTYQFWIAKRMTLATATFQGQAYPVGNRYGRDIGFAPAVPADVSVTATLYVNSDPKNAKTISYTGKASPAGLFGAAQGMVPLPFDAPGEYHAVVLAKYTDADGHLWVSTMRHAGVVYPDDSPIVAHGKKLNVKGKLVDRGDTTVEGWVDTTNNVNHLEHINYPYLSGDVLLIASEQQGANKIEPVLTYEMKNNPAPYDAQLQNIGATNVRLQTSNGYSPHQFPEYITDWAYYYAGAPRPGFMSRFLVGEDGVRAPYWPTSPNSFGGQINASVNGDLPGDIYRLIGGVVVRKSNAAPMYAGYLSSGFILPKGTNHNRVIAAGSEDLIGSTGDKARFFLVGLRPGMVYETGTAFAPAVQIDPIVPATITFTMKYPDGRQVVAQGVGDSFGGFVGKERWTLDLPGIYQYTLEGEWQGNKGYMPGLPKTGGEFYVVEKQPPANATGLSLNLPNQSTFPVTSTLTIRGNSGARYVYYAAVTPGAALLQGRVPVNGGKFEYVFNPAEVNKVASTYDIKNLVTGRPQISDVVQLTFFSQETTPTGTPYHSFVRLIIRGNTVIYAR
ncbi:MAG: hypothetical protein HY782_08825 [Chloroflexi bacterium]|nr:hypothetical protein [Chloroflexota bacterium]